jgi:hypothetical protein
VYEHLRGLRDRPEVISLFLHSNGGEVVVPWKLVTLIREYCTKLRVLVPNRAFSAATLTALGADEIFMHPMGMLGPTDPSITGPYNPRLNPSDPNSPPLPISVEEVLAYIALVTEDVGIRHEDELVQAFNKLVDHVHPIALGSVKRSHAQSRMMAKKLMLVAGGNLDEHRIDEIVANLTSRLYYHGHPINRDEAKHLGLRITASSGEIEDAMWGLYEEYEKDMLLLEPWNQAHTFIRQTPTLMLGQQGAIDLPKANLVFVESRHRCDSFTMDIRLFGTKDATGGVNTQLYINRQGWETET